MSSLPQGAMAKWHNTPNYLYLVFVSWTTVDHTPLGLCHIPSSGAFHVPEGKAMNTSHSMSMTLSKYKQIK